MRRLRESIPITLFVATLVACTSKSLGLELASPRRPQPDHKHSPLQRQLSQKQDLDEVPLKGGIWEENLIRGTQVVVGPFRREQSCPGLLSIPLFLSLPATEHFGQPFSDKVLVPDSVSLLPDGRYRVTGGAGTHHGGSVLYEHLITLHGSDHYQDELTITSHSNTHPLKHFYTGNGHWVAPCSPAPQ